VQRSVLFIYWFSVQLGSSQVYLLVKCEIVQLFSVDRKYYNRTALVKHRKHGDDDDRSYRGHPQCEFCDVRFFDNDELLRHLRKQHYYCHFCEADGVSNEYFWYISFTLGVEHSLASLIYLLTSYLESFK
jgi:hypothetical protein